MTLIVFDFESTEQEEPPDKGTETTLKAAFPKSQGLTNSDPGLIAQFFDDLEDVEDYLDNKDAYMESEPEDANDIVSRMVSLTQINLHHSKAASVALLF